MNMITLHMHSCLMTKNPHIRKLAMKGGREGLSSGNTYSII